MTVTTGSALMTSFKNGCPAYLTSAVSAASATGLVVIQEWWGLNDQIKAVANRFAEAGKFKAVVAPDLYHGKVATKEDEAKHLMDGLDWVGAVKDIQAAVDYLKDEKGCTKVGVVGFCMGGALSIASAVKVNRLDASVCFYGIPDPKFANPDDIKCPIQLHFGNKDAMKGFSSPQDADALEARLKKAGKSFEIHRYDADHAFMNEKGPRYNEGVSKIATEKTIAYLTRVLSA